MTKTLEEEENEKKRETSLQEKSINENKNN